MAPSAIPLHPLSGLTLTAVLLSPTLLGAPPAALARGEGFAGGGAGRGGFARGGFGGGLHPDSLGGGHYHFGGGQPDAWRGGYQGVHPLYGPGVRPNYGSTLERAPFNRQVNVNTNFYNRSFNSWNRNWSNGGYWANRPWNAGWYRWTPATWGWWGGNAAVWGLTGLATGVAITSLVNSAAQQESPVILVPQTSYMLNYGSVEAVGQAGVSFFYTVNGTQLVGAANCQQGLLNGQIPSTGDQAQLLNAVCQVAYGAGS